MTKATWGRKSCFRLTVPHEGKMGQELQAGTGKQELKQEHEGILFTALLSVAGSACFLIQPMNGCPGAAPVTVG